jgi:hypothetical protein
MRELMTRIRITKLQRDERGFFTANVTAEGADTVRVDNAIGCWTLPVDPRAEPGARVVRREILPWVVKLLNDRIKGFLRGEVADEDQAHEIEAGGGFRARRRNDRRTSEGPEGPTDVPPDPEDIARRMAKAASAALKEAA